MTTTDSTTPPQPDAAGMLADWFSEWRGGATTDDKDRRRAGDLMDWINQSGFVLRAAPAPADPDRPSRAEVLAAVTSYAAYTRGTESTRTKEDRKEAERLEADAWEKVWTLIERLTPKAGASAGGE
jgi:hypothetical protein